MLNTITDEELRKMYWDEGKSGKEIATLLGCTPSAVCMRMKASNIPARLARDYPPTEKMKAAWVKNGIRLRTERYMTSEKVREIGKKNKGKRRRSDYEFGGHEKRRCDGYIKVYCPDHPRSSADGYVMKHILVMERQIGRYLQPNEVVHHINHIRDDNRIENLMLMTKHDHMSMHMRERHAERRKENAQ